MICSANKDRYVYLVPEARRSSASRSISGTILMPYVIPLGFVTARRFVLKGFLRTILGIAMRAASRGQQVVSATGLNNMPSCLVVSLLQLRKDQARL